MCANCRLDSLYISNQRSIVPAVRFEAAVLRAYPIDVLAEETSPMLSLPAAHHSIYIDC